MAEKDRNKKMKEIMERLEQGVKEIFTSGKESEDRRYQPGIEEINP